MKWTKCKDRIPREPGEYIITFIDSKGVKRSSVGSYSPNFKMWTRHGYLLETVIAWTLLPEPMSDESRSNTCNAFPCVISVSGSNTLDVMASKGLDSVNDKIPDVPEEERANLERPDALKMVECISEADDRHIVKRISVGKSYRVHEDSGYMYQVIDDIGLPTFYHKDHFKQ